MSSQAAADGPRFGGVRAPTPRLAPAEEEKLTPRQRELLDVLEELAVEGGFAELTMAELAARMNCSLRTLYGLAPSKDALLLAVIDRRLHRIGRAAREAITPSMNALEALRTYLSAATTAVGPTTEAFARDLAAVPGGAKMTRAHGNYVIAITRRLLDRAVEEKLIEKVDTAALALVLGGLGGFFARPEVIPLLEGSPKATSDAIMEILIRGLERG